MSNGVHHQRRATDKLFSNKEVEETLLHSYTTSQAESILTLAHADSIDTIMDQNILIEAIKKDVVKSIHLSIEDTTYAQIQEVLFQDLRQSLPLSNEAILTSLSDITAPIYKAIGDTQTIQTPKQFIQSIANAVEEGLQINNTNIEEYTNVHTSLESNISTFIAQFSNKVFDISDALGTLLLTTIHEYGLDMQEVILNAFPDDLVEVIETLSFSITSPNTSEIFSNLDFKTILEDLGVTLEIDSNGIISNEQTQIRTYFSNIPFQDLTLNETNESIAALNELFESLVQVIKTQLNQVINITDEVLTHSIIEKTNEIMIEKSTKNITALNNEINDTFGLNDVDYTTLFNTYVTNVISELTSDISVSVDDVKNSVRINIFEQLNMDTSFLDKTESTEVTPMNLSDIFSRLSAEEENISLATVCYFLNRTVPVITIVKDSKGNIIEEAMTSETIVSISQDGNYTIINEEFETLSSLFSVEVSFNYFVSNTIIPMNINEETSMNDSKVMTVTINLEDDTASIINGTIQDEYIEETEDMPDNQNEVYGDESDNEITYDSTLTLIDGAEGTDTLVLNEEAITFTDTADNDYIDIAILLSNIKVKNIEVLRSGDDTDHIMINLTLSDLLSITDDKNILKIDLNKSDEIKLDSSIWQTSPTNDEEGYMSYTSITQNNVKLLIDDIGNITFI